MSIKFGLAKYEMGLNTKATRLDVFKQLAHIANQVRNCQLEEKAVIDLFNDSQIFLLQSVKPDAIARGLSKLAALLADFPHEQFQLLNDESSMVLYVFVGKDLEDDGPVLPIYEVDDLTDNSTDLVELIRHQNPLNAKVKLVDDDACIFYPEAPRPRVLQSCYDLDAIPSRKPVYNSVRAGSRVYRYVEVSANPAASFDELITPYFSDPFTSQLALVINLACREGEAIKLNEDIVNEQSMTIDFRNLLSGSFTGSPPSSLHLVRVPRNSRELMSSTQAVKP
eukprot:TRINITY_DN14238_c0_g1_i1.p1 TRINITY_DN14238_c0_g1~~TRINITY_DN14238_c0_g1_i1.p1  ORF type:complete len:301 (+),score=32.58 TRINITY_DN14238_c0_g1_i1:63-905(+)